MTEPSFSFIGCHLIEVERTLSTNSLLAELVRHRQLPEGTALIASFQEQGRGYASNRWFSDPGCNLLVSILLCPRFLLPANQFFLNQAVSLAIARLIKELMPSALVHIKWPNDILLNGRKVAGILIENVIEGSHWEQAIVGIGLNVNQNKFPVDLPFATSLHLESGLFFDLTEVRSRLFAHMTATYLQLRNGHMMSIVEAYNRQLFGRDEQRNFQTDLGSLTGTITGVTPQGALIVESKGRTRTFQFKEIVQPLH